MTAGRPIQIGDIILLTLPQQGGREQLGRRPCVVVAIPDRVGTPRFPTAFMPYSVQEFTY
jgi:mRNA interferase MazF